MRLRTHCIVAALIVLAWRPASAGPSGRAHTQAVAPRTGSATFTVFVQGRPVGAEQATLHQNADGWTIQASGRLDAPINIVTERFEARYDAAWQPLGLTIAATRSGQAFAIRTVVKGTTATSETTQGANQFTSEHTIAADAVLLPNSFFSAYEALAARLHTMPLGAELRVYVVPQAEVTATVKSVREERIQTAVRTVNIRVHEVALANPAGPLLIQISSDDRGRLARVSIPSVAFDVIRDDIASVAARQQSHRNPRDHDVTIPASGFNLAATVTMPVGETQPKQRFPAIVLVAGSGPQDRDETVAGIPIFGQLAGALSDMGFLVVRYDKRGVGQSGGRPESAGLGDYADDVQSGVRYLKKRKDVDAKRIAVVGHSEGGWSGLLAAARDKSIRSLVLVATAAVTGAELVLEQQRHVLEQMAITDEDRRAKVELQQKIQQAVVSGKGWEGIPPEMRKQAETPWFQSMLTFDPARVMPKTRQPMLILHGELDRQVPPVQADRLADLARARKQTRNGKAPVAIVKLPGVNHLLVTATTGEVSEYSSLTGQSISAEVPARIAAWLKQLPLR